MHLKMCVLFSHVETILVHGLVDYKVKEDS